MNETKALIQIATLLSDAEQEANGSAVADMTPNDADAPQDSEKQLVEIATILPEELVKIETILPDTTSCPKANDDPLVEYIIPEKIPPHAQLGFPAAVTANAKKCELLPPLPLYTGPLCYDTLRTYIVIDDGKGLVAVPPEKAPRAEEPLLAKGKGYVVRRSGLYCTTKNGDDVFVSNARLQITGFINHVTADESRSGGFNTVKSVEGFAILPDGKHHRFIVEKNNFKTLYSKLHKEHPDIIVHSVSSPGLENYLTDIYTQAQNTGIRARFTFEYSRWYELRDGHPEYHTSSNPEYGTAALASLSSKNRYQIFSEGNGFLTMGDIAAIGPIWLFFHAAFTNYFYKKAGCSWGLTMLIEGKTGSKKTSLMKLLADPLNADRTAGIISIEQDTTAAGLLRVMNQQYCDNFVCLDDYTGLALQTSKAEKLAELVFRLVGDGSSRIKAKGKSGTTRQTANCIFVVTAEKNFMLTESSYARYVRVFFDKQVTDPSTGMLIKPGTVDVRALTHFQQHPELIQEYLSLYLRFLEENGLGLMDWIKHRFIELRAEHSATFKHDRLTDALAHLVLQAEVIARFASWCGCSQDEVTALMQALTVNLAETINQQAELLKDKEPAELFMEMLENCTDMQKELADTEKIWLENPTAYLGFREEATHTLWLRYDEVYDRLSRYASKMSYPVPEYRGISQLLFEAGYTKAIIKETDGKKKYTYLPKSKKGTSNQRRGMLVLFEHRVNDFFNKYYEEGE